MKQREVDVNLDTAAILSCKKDHARWSIIGTVRCSVSSHWQWGMQVRLALSVGSVKTVCILGRNICSWACAKWACKLPHCTYAPLKNAQNGGGSIQMFFHCLFLIMRKMHKIDNVKHMSSMASFNVSHSSGNETGISRIEQASLKGCHTYICSHCKVFTAPIRCRRNRRI